MPNGGHVQRCRDFIANSFTVLTSHDVVMDEKDFPAIR